MVGIAWNYPLRGYTPTLLNFVNMVCRNTTIINDVLIKFWSELVLFLVLTFLTTSITVYCITFERFGILALCSKTQI